MLFIHFKSVFSFKFYHRLVQLTAKQTVLFVLYLFVLSNIVCYFVTGSVIKKNLPVFLKNFPQVTFEKGVLTAPDHAVSAPLPQTDFKIVFDASATQAPSAEELLQNYTLAWVHKNQVYIPSTNGFQIQTIPDNISFTSSQETLQKYKGTLRASLRATLLITSLFVIGLILFFDFFMALGVLLFFNIMRQAGLPKSLLLKYAAFLLGPITVLWLMRLWVNIPLFALAQLFVCIIYTQQIFNSLPGVPHEN